MLRSYVQDLIPDMNGQDGAECWKRRRCWEDPARTKNTRPPFSSGRMIRERGRDWECPMEAENTQPPDFLVVCAKKRTRAGDKM